MKNETGQMTTLMQEGLYGEIDLSVIAEPEIFPVVIYLASAVFKFAVHCVMATDPCLEGF